MTPINLHLSCMMLIIATIDDKFVVVCSYRCTNELGEVIIQSTTGMLCFLCFIVYFCFFRSVIRCVQTTTRNVVLCWGRL